MIVSPRPFTPQIRPFAAKLLTSAAYSAIIGPYTSAQVDGSTELEVLSWTRARALRKILGW